MRGCDMAEVASHHVSGVSCWSMKTQSENALVVDQFSKRYRGGVVAVDGISFSVPRGAFFGFLGPNGAGKTTTISCITGISYPSDGSISVFGFDVVKQYKEARRNVGLSPQEFNVDIFAKVEKILEYSGGFFGLTSPENVSRRTMLLEKFSLTKYAATPFMQLSGGFKRRVMLARALMHDPDLLILDEPTAGVDVEQRYELWGYLEELNKAGKTIILTSHYIEEVERLCDTVAIITNGTIAAQGPLADFTKGTRTLEAAYLSIAGGKEFGEVQATKG
jgi:ABC-2 type transport system ATP-binding protein